MQRGRNGINGFQVQSSLRKQSGESNIHSYYCKGISYNLVVPIKDKTSRFTFQMNEENGK